GVRVITRFTFIFFDTVFLKITTEKSTKISLFHKIIEWLSSCRCCGKARIIESSTCSVLELV
ncbi:MAG: hypothetical protein ACI8RD_013561, partial [Bacillariaceae sp.]